MASLLLSLPQELRDFIIEQALTSRGDAPPQLDKEAPTKEHDDLTYVSRIGGRGVLYTARDHLTSPFSLLLVNHQLHDETEAALKRFRTAEGNKYDMDIILANEELIHPTWTSVPPLVRNVDSFAVTFRIFGIGDNNTNGFMDAEGSVGATVWRLYSVLERFLRCGAAPARSFTEDRQLKLKLLDINVDTPKLTEGSQLAPDHINPDNLPKHRCENSPHNQVMHPLTLAKFMYVWIEGILRLSHPGETLPSTAITNYSKLFFERVGEIAVSVDGKRLFDIDVAEMAKEIAERKAWFETP